MKRYNVKVEEIKTTEFELNAKNKKEAQTMVEDIILKTYILDLKCVKSKKSYFMNVRKSKNQVITNVTDN